MRLRIAVVVGAALVLAAGCKGTKDPSDEERIRIPTRDIPRVARDLSGSYPLGRQVPQTAPAAAFCPAGHGVECGDRCCPDGSTCLEYWGAKKCAFEATPASCNAGEKACVAPFQCGPDACLLPNDVGMAVNVYMADPADMRPGRFGTALTGGLPAGSCAAPSIYGSPTTLPSGSAPCTLEAWVRTSHHGPQAVLAYGTGSEVRALELPEIGAEATASTVRFRLGAASCDATGLSSAAAAPALHDGAWHHLAATYDSGEAKVYVDGALEQTCPVAAPATPASSTLLFGNAPRASGSAPCFPLQGEIDEVRILAQAASAAQIALDATDELTAIAGTVGLWHLEKGLVTVRCCPESGTCSTIGECRAASTVDACPASHPVECADGSCCPAGTSCDPTSGCVLPPATRATCTAGQQECSDGTCCPTDMQCLGSGRCGLPVTGGPSRSVCPAGSVDASADGQHFCCPQAAGRDVVGFGPGSAYAECLPTGTTARCGTIPLYDTTCSAGYAWCGAASPGACVAGGTELPCPNGGAACNGPLGLMEQCCPNATDVCRGTTCCGGLGDQVCGAGCCPPATECNGAAGRCEVAAQPRVCGPTAAPSCNAECCPEGSTCDPIGGCVAGGTATRTCPTGYSVACGDACCADGARCEWGRCVHAVTYGHCEPGFNVCDANVSTVCCPTSLSCEKPRTTTVCAAAPTLKEGAHGVACGGGRCLAWDDICIGEAGCCGATTSGCGDVCCNYGCGESGCLCPTGAAPCGEVCCNGGEECVGGQCLPACPPGEASCGESCCGAGIACVNGECTCGGELPQSCGESCCAADTRCAPDGAPGSRCLCPDTRPTCGGYCCFEDEVCAGSECVEREEPGGGGSDGIPCNGAVCTGGAICVATQSCVKGFSGCQCSGSLEGVCKDFVANGYPVTECVTNGPSEYLACCPGQVWVNGRCQPSCE